MATPKTLHEQIDALQSEVSRLEGLNREAMELLGKATRIYEQDTTLWIEWEEKRKRLLSRASSKEETKHQQ